MINEKLPKESLQQEAGHYGVIALNATHPLGWRPTETDGDSDAGLDLQVQVVKDGHYKSMFNAQVKACTQSNENGLSKRLNADKTHYSQELKISTLNYYARIENPIMLIFADLCLDSNPRKCKTFYIWIDDELELLLAGHSDLTHLNKDTHTFHVPIENEINDSLDVLPYLASRLEKKRKLNGLYQQIENHVDNPLEILAQVQSHISSRTAIDTITTEVDFPWMEPPEGTIAYDLKSSASSVSNNNIDIATEQLKKLKRKISQSGSNHEKAEFYYQKGTITSTAGNQEKARSLLMTAYELCPDIARYKIPYIESQLYENYSNDSKCKSYLDEIEEEKDVLYVHLKLKILAGLKKFDDAHEIISKLKDEDTVVLKPLIFFLEDNLTECISSCEYSLESFDLNNKQQLSIRIIKSRSLFQLGAGEVFRKHIGNIIPFSGLPGMDVATLKQSWNELKTAWNLAEKLNYPSNIEFIVDITAILCFYFDESEIFYSRLKHIAKTRPESLFLQESLLNVAQQVNDQDVILQQLNLLPDSTQKVIHQALLKNTQNKKSELLQLVLDHLDKLSKELLPYTDIVFALATEAAQILVKNQERDILLAEVDKLENSAAMHSIIQFLTSVNENYLSRSQAIEKLYEKYKKGISDLKVLVLLFDYLNPDIELEAHRLIEVAESIQNERGLFESEYLKLCRAKATIHDWKPLLVTMNDALNRFGPKPKLLALKALSLDELGQTSEAIKVLEHVVQNDKYDSYPLQLYAHISARCGLTNKSKILFESLLEQAANNHDKAEIYRILFVLEMSSNPSSRRLLGYCMKYGQLNNKDDENEEGTFLMLFFGATNNKDIKPTEEQVKAFQNRLSAYGEKFPESKFCRQVTFSASPSGEEMLEKLHELTGMNQQQLDLYEKNESLLKSGQLQIPYPIRPSILLNVPDILYLWQLTKYAEKNLKQYQLLIATSDYKFFSSRALEREIVLIDEVGIILLFDAGLIDELFLTFPKVAITKNTLMRFQNWSQHVFMSPLADKAKAILNQLSLHISNIIQPTCHNKISLSVDLSDLEEYQRIINNYNFIFYSDDFITRLFVCGDNYAKKSICTLEFLNLLKEKRILSKVETACKIAKLCAWNIGGVQILFLDILHIASLLDIPDHNISKIVTSMRKSKELNHIIDYLWTLDKTIKNSLIDIGNFISLMVAGEDGLIVKDDYISAFWYTWYRKVQFHHDAGNRSYILSNSFIAVVVALLKRFQFDSSCRSKAIHLWAIYIGLMSFLYENKMDDKVYNQSIESLSNVITRLNQDLREDVFHFVSAGFTDGTHDSELFHASYSTVIIEKNKKSDKQN